MRQIYLDNNATTPLAPEVRQAMAPCLDQIFGNPSSGHRFGEAADSAVGKAREQVATLLQCRPNRVVFTSGGTESNNLAIHSAVTANPDRRHIITSTVEHASVLSPLAFYQGKGYEVEYLPVDSQGRLAASVVEAAIRADTALVTLMAANNETGVVWPLGAIGRICRARGVLFHTDAVQYAGKMPINLGELPVDYLAIAAHKLHGPKGVGALYAARQAPVTPLIMGAGQEGGRRAGTENVAGIVGFGRACELAGSDIERQSLEIAVLRQRFEEGVLASVADVLINGHEALRLPNTSNVSFKNCAAGAIIQELDERGVAVSAHSACHSGDLDPSHVLNAMAVPEEFRHGTLRVSLSRYNTEGDIDRLLALLPGVVAKSRTVFVA